MSSEREQVDRIAERIAKRLTEGGETTKSANGGESDLRRTLQEIERRLAHIESHIAHDENCAEHSSVSPYSAAQQSADERALPVVSNRSVAPLTSSSTYVSSVPASEERFGVNEAVAELVDYFEREKICELEPGGKRCDHCAMCSARGF